MASETATTTGIEAESDETWRAGVAAGLAGGAVMGVMLSVMMTPVIEVAIPAMYGLSGGLAGWVVHMSHAAVLGVGFAALVPLVLDEEPSLARSAGLGAAYGVVLWVVLAAVVMPVWLGAVGFPNAPPLPNFNPKSLVGHVVYGVVLGAVYPMVADR